MKNHKNVKFHVIIVKKYNLSFIWIRISASYAYTPLAWGRIEMKEFYIDTFNCLFIPEKTANFEKILSDFYKTDIAPVNDDTVRIDASAAFSRNAYHFKVLGIGE